MVCTILAVLYGIGALCFAIHFLSMVWSLGEPFMFLICLPISPIMGLLWGPLAMFWLIAQILCMPIKLLMGYRWNSDIFG